MMSVVETWMRPGARVARVEIHPDLLTEDGILTSVCVGNPLPADVEIRRVATNRANGMTVVYLESDHFVPRRPNSQPEMIDPQVTPAIAGGAPWTFLWTVRQWMQQDPNRGD